MTEKLTIAELKALAKARGVPIVGLRLKRDLVKALGGGADEEKKFTFGVHVSPAKIGKARGAMPNMNAAQIFLFGPRGYRQNVKGDAALAKVREDADGLSLWVHSTYMTDPWKKGGAHHLVDQLNASREVGARGLIVHLPDKEVAELADGLVEVKAAAERSAAGGGCLVVLEMKALKQSPRSFESWAKLHALTVELERVGYTPASIGLCIDTAHIYASGAAIRTYEEATEWLKDVDPKWVRLIHLNGNEYDATKRAGDKHAVPFDKSDFIWKGIAWKKSGCRAFVDWCHANQIPFVLEIKSKHTYADVAAWAAYAQSG